MDADKSDLEEVVTDEKAVFEELKAAVSGSLSIRLYQDRLLSLASLYNIAGQVSAALKQKVWLKSGANLVIEPTEALTVIDVNSGKNTEKKTSSATIIKSIWRPQRKSRFSCACAICLGSFWWILLICRAWMIRKG